MQLLCMFVRVMIRNWILTFGNSILIKYFNPITLGVLPLYCSSLYASSLTLLARKPTVSDGWWSRRVARNNKNKTPPGSQNSAGHIFIEGVLFCTTSLEDVGLHLKPANFQGATLFSVMSDCFLCTSHHQFLNTFVFKNVHLITEIAAYLICNKHRHNVFFLYAICAWSLSASLP